jgi:ferrous iron transport protein A
MRMVLNKATPLPLSELSPGASAEIVGFCAREGLEDFFLRLNEVGFVVGESVEVLQRAPFGGSPMSFRVKDATYALRKEDASLILVSPVSI